jgi:hypothetical protein
MPACASHAAASRCTCEFIMRRPDLLSDCASCAAVCCIATAFEASEDFAFDKRAGVGCRHLTPDCRCAIHTDRVERGFSGCVVYECYGAGQRVTRMFAGTCGAQGRRDEAFMILRVVHEWLWLLTEAAKLCPPSHADISTQLVREIEALDAIAAGPLAALFEWDLRPHQAASRALLLRVGEALGGRRRASRSLVVID